MLRQLVILGGALALPLSLFLVATGGSAGARPISGSAVSAPTSERPELALERPDGSRTRLAALRGRPVVVHFWATWCGPCRDELPGLLEFAETGEIQVLTVSLDAGFGAVRDFFGGTVPPAVLRADTAEAERAFGLTALPFSYVLGPEGAVRLRMPGAHDWGRRETVAQVLEAAGGNPLDGAGPGIQRPGS